MTYFVKKYSRLFFSTLVFLVSFSIVSAQVVECHPQDQHACILSTMVLQEQGVAISEVDRCAVQGSQTCFTRETGVELNDDFTEVIGSLSVEEQGFSRDDSGAIYETTYCFSGGEDYSQREEQCEVVRQSFVTSGIEMNIANTGSDGCYARGHSGDANRESCFILPEQRIEDDDLLQEREEVTGEGLDAGEAVSLGCVAQSSGAGTSVYNTETCCYMGLDSQTVNDQCEIARRSDSDTSSLVSNPEAGNIIQVESSCSSDVSTDGTVRSCYTRQLHTTLSEGSGWQCGDQSITRNTDGTFDQTEFERSMAQCETIRQYYRLEGQQVPDCSPRFATFSSVGGYLLNVWESEDITEAFSDFTNEFRACFDASGLSRISNEEIQNIERAERARLQREREAAIAAAQDAHSSEISRRDAELGRLGGLVPCTGGGTRADGTVSCGWDDLIDLANQLIRFAIGIASIVMVVVILWAGWGLVTSRGNGNALQEARGRFTKALIGFVIVLTAWLIVDTVLGLLLSDEFKDDAVVNILEE